MPHASEQLKKGKDGYNSGMMSKTCSTAKDKEDKKDGAPMERVSVSAISLRHILASTGYAPGTIAVNVTWMKRGFNGCHRHRSMHSSIFNRLQTIARYWSEIATFFLPLAFNAHVGVFPLEFQKKVWTSEN